MPIRYSQHFLHRQALRVLPEGVAEEVYLNADEHFEDEPTGTLVAVKRLALYNAERDLALVNRRSGEDVIFITIPPLKQDQKERRVRSGRWTPYEPESSL